MPKIKLEKPGFFEIVWEFDKLIDSLLKQFDYIDIDNNELAQRAIELAPRYKSVMNDDNIFGHLMDYKTRDNEHIRNCAHCHLLQEAEQLVVYIRRRRADAWKRVSALDELWNGPRKRPSPSYDYSDEVGILTESSFI
ncbi:hypothetical protein [Paraburkholderia flagellata]|uniref:hypothetical protein n=1 Tax=Paraburkholderia flagellata TaxID=2883241 RepID=UPI001F3ABFD1|nr:hypothetical protein [Paraburkholderia flagellata]